MDSPSILDLNSPLDGKTQKSEFGYKFSRLFTNKIIKLKDSPYVGITDRCVKQKTIEKKLKKIEKKPRVLVETKSVSHSSEISPQNENYSDRNSSNCIKLAPIKEIKSHQKSSNFSFGIEPMTLSPIFSNKKSLVFTQKHSKINPKAIQSVDQALQTDDTLNPFVLTPYSDHSSFQTSFDLGSYTLIN